MKKIEDKSRRKWNFSDLIKEKGGYRNTNHPLFALMGQGAISPMAFSAMAVIIKNCLEVDGESTFPLSNADLQKALGVGEKPVRRAIDELQSAGLIKMHPAKNGYCSTVEILPDVFRTYSETEHPSSKTEELGASDLLRNGGALLQNGVGVLQNGVGSDGRNDDFNLLQNGGASILSILLDSLSNLRKNLLSKKQQQFDHDIGRLLKDGYSPDFIRACLEFEMPDLGKISSFYAVITSKADRAGELVEKYQILLERKKAALRSAQERHATATHHAPELTFITPASMTKGSRAKTLLNQNLEVT